MNRRTLRLSLRGFEFFFRPWMRRRIRLCIAGLPRCLPSSRPLLLTSNHVSWWDAFVLREIQRILRPEAPVYTVMSSGELQRLPFFRRLGAVGIDSARPGSVASALRTLQRRTRENPDSVVLFFPQGRIWPSFKRPLGFQRGIELFVRHLSPVIVLPVALHMEPLNTLKPTVFASLAEPVPVAGGPIDHRYFEGLVEEAADRIHSFLAQHGEDAPRHWPQSSKSLTTAEVEIQDVVGRMAGAS